jgi:hypothetical protein
VWTGREAVFFLENGGLAYDPANLTWRTIAPPPIDVGRSAVHVWTGTQVFVWGGGRRGEPTSAEGALYDPSADSWQRIADAPIGLTLASGMWTGREVIVFGSLLDGRNVAETPTSVGAAYDPITDTWQELPASSLSPQAASAFWVGDRMVAWDYEVHSQQFDPVRDTWAAPAQMPFHFDECYPESAVVGGLGFAFFCGQSALYDAATSAWREIHGGPLDEEIGANDASYKLWRFASLAPADDVLFLQMEGITVVGKDDTPCYGCPGSPVSFWAYRP